MNCTHSNLIFRTLKLTEYREWTVGNAKRIKSWMRKTHGGKRYVELRQGGCLFLIILNIFDFN